ncbi:hypothetical protein Ahy_B02g060659 [Arachis hypogaea]|uniref:Uncharacterized protein n=1 Tax=Arachis hypogaea TaxID=3818 RepID=A0A445AJ66_ARAHY|nr:hypothetical protein Ahy_B02g060659 [Arachis hypogaea]
MLFHSYFSEIPFYPLRLRNCSVSSPKLREESHLHSLLPNSLSCRDQLHQNIAGGFGVSGITAVVVGVASSSSIEIHHGGKFVDSGQRLEYLGGMVVKDLHFEVDEWSLQEIFSQLKQLGYKGFARVWYKEPGMDLKSGLRELKSDGDAMRMARSLVSNSCKHCEVYVVDGARESKGIEITSTDADYVSEEGEDSADDDGLLEVEVDAESEPSTEEEVFDDSADDGDHDDQFGFEVEDNDPPSNAFGGFTGPLNDERTAAAGTAEGDEGLREGDEQLGSLSDGYETDDIDSYEGDFDDMIKKRRFPKYNEAEMNREYEFQVGLEFKSLSQFKEAVKEHALLNGRDIRFRKNDKVRCRVVCKGRKGKCKWVCFASKVGGSDCFRIKTLNEKHTCGMNYSGRLASSSWISKKIANNISRGEEMKLATVIQTIQDKYMANISVAPEGTRGSDAATGAGGVDSAANEPAAADKANGSAATATARSRMVKGGGRGRAAGGMARGRGRGRAAPMTATASRPSNTPAPTSQPPHTPAPPSQPPHTPAPTSQPPHTHAPPSQPPHTHPAPPSQPTTLPTLASLPTTLPTPASLPTAPASQPLSKTKIFGVRRSGRLKIGVRKATNQPPEHVDLTLD